MNELTLAAQRVRLLEEHILNSGAKSHNDIEGIRIYRREVTYEGSLKGDRGQILLVFDVPKEGIKPALAAELSEIAGSYVSTQLCAGIRPPRTLIGFSEHLRSVRIYGFNAQGKSYFERIPGGDQIVLKMNAAGSLEESTILALKTALQNAQENKPE